MFFPRWWYFYKHAKHIENDKSPQVLAKKLAYKNKDNLSMGRCLHLHLHEYLLGSIITKHAWKNNFHKILLEKIQQF